MRSSSRGTTAPASSRRSSSPVRSRRPTGTWCEHAKTRAPIALLRGTHSGVAGLYTADPRTTPDAILLDEVTYLDVLNRGLRALDSTAITLCMENALPIVVFDLLGKGNVRRIVDGERIGTLIH